MSPTFRSSCCCVAIFRPSGDHESAGALLVVGCVQADRELEAWIVPRCAMQTVGVEVPLAEVTTYARSLSSMTGGQGSYTLEFSHYDAVPPNIQQEILTKAKVQEEEE